MPLGPNQQALVAQANAQELRKQFRSVAAQWPNNRWLSINNRYAVDTTNRLEADVQSGASVAHTQLSRYIAASTLIHCVDGWSYLARALEAVLSGDIHAATHLAYYAELRAAMSTLAAVGVGVFDQRHFVVATDKKCHLVNGRTHTFAWDALSHWATQPSASSLVLDIIQPGGVSLKGWLGHFPAAAGATLRGRLVSNWLLDWGVDLKLFVEDREARNQASYRPTAIPHAVHPDFATSLEFLEGFWTSFQPTALHPFRILDRYLLRRSMAQAFLAANGATPRRAPRAYMRFVRIVLHAVNPSDFAVSDWESFLDVTGTGQSDLPVIDTAEGKARRGSVRYYAQVISRAALLLRVANGASRALLAALSPTERADLAFWWRALGEEKGLWDVAPASTNLVDLWTDVETAITQSQAWRAAPSSRKTFLTANSYSARALSSCDRIPLWSLGL